MTSDSPFPKDQIAVIEKQIDRLRKEVDERMSSNHTLWRAGLAGIGAFILLKESIDLSRVVLALPVLGMGLAAHWLNQLLTLYRSGDAMAGCEARINSLAGFALLDHELTLSRMRRQILVGRRLLFVLLAAVVTAVYWFALWQGQPSATNVAALLLWRVALAAALLVNIAAAINLRRFILFPWTALTSAEALASFSREAAA